MTSDADVADAQNAGLLLGVAALMGALRSKGLLDEAEIDQALGSIADAIEGSGLAQATPQDSMIQATLAPIQQLRRLNGLYDSESGNFPGWLDDAG